jgi:hypothetical protein
MKSNKIIGVHFATQAHTQSQFSTSQPFKLKLIQEKQLVENINNSSHNSTKPMLTQQYEP